MRAPVKAAAAFVALSLLAAGCGGEAEEPAPEPPPPPPPETLHQVPDLGDRWSVHRNRAGGFALGVPPGWRARNQGVRTLVRSFDRLAAVSIIPDRTAIALELPVEQFAERALAALPGFERELAPDVRRGFRHRYDAALVRTAARATESGIRQRVTLVVVRREPHVTFTAVIAANAEGGRASERIAERMLRTLRSRPIAGAPTR